jgi:hypothetical protein
MSIVVNDGNSAPINVHNITLKHGSHNQASHGKGGSSAGGGAGVAGGSPNEKKMNSSLDRAKGEGASESAVSSVRDAHATRNMGELDNLEAGFFEASVGRHGVGRDQAMIELHSATVYALRDLGRSNAEAVLQSEMR